MKQRNHVILYSVISKREVSTNIIYNSNKCPQLEPKYLTTIVHCAVKVNGKHTCFHNMEWRGLHSFL
jgi:hypothetical protein